MKFSGAPPKEFVGLLIRQLEVLQSNSPRVFSTLVEYLSAPGYRMITLKSKGGRIGVAQILETVNEDEQEL